MGSHKKVVGVAASPNITFVANKKSFRDGAYSQFVGLPVSAPSLVVDSENSVPTTVCGSLPEPTVIRSSHIHIRPESLGKRGGVYYACP
jgi:hypothetical protein